MERLEIVPLLEKTGQRARALSGALLDRWKAPLHVVLTSRGGARKDLKPWQYEPLRTQQTTDAFYL